jgi:hypothetical protein
MNLSIHPAVQRVQAGESATPKRLPPCGKTRQDSEFLSMAMGTRKQREKQEGLWIAHTELASAPGHLFY